MSSTLPSDFPDRLNEFQQQIMACQAALRLPNGDRPAVAAQIKQLETIIQDHLLTLPLELIPLAHQSLWLSLKTELHRTLRLLMTELSFWQMARSGDRQRHYQKRLQDHCQQLADFAQVMGQWLEPLET
jgi:hypothetical protein